MKNLINVLVLLGLMTAMYLPFTALAETETDEPYKYLKYAELSAAVYGNASWWKGEDKPSNKEDLKKWEAVQELSKEWEMVAGKEKQDDKSGFYAAVYKNKITGEVVLAFRGTQEVKDWANNAVNYLGGNADQYQEAMNYAAEIKKEYPEVILTGHSLGGGLAQLAAYKCGLDSVTFNSAEISSEIISTISPPTANTSRVEIHTKGDVVTGVQEWLGPLLGKKIASDVDLIRYMYGINYGWLYDQLTGIPISEVYRMLSDYFRNINMFQKTLATRSISVGTIVNWHPIEDIIEILKKRRMHILPVVPPDQNQNSTIAPVITPGKNVPVVVLPVIPGKSTNTMDIFPPIPPVPAVKHENEYSINAGSNVIRNQTRIIKPSGGSVSSGGGGSRE